jgi:AraC-like DNA-binding protein
MIAQVTSRPAAAQHLSDLVLLRRVRDRMDREYAQPLDVEALASGVNMSAGHLSRQFRRAYGESPYSYLMTRRIERAMALLRRCVPRSRGCRGRRPGRRPGRRAGGSSREW